MVDITVSEFLMLAMPHIRRMVREEMEKREKPIENDELWDTTRLVKELSVTRQTIASYIDKGLLKDVGPGRKILVRKSDVLRVRANLSKGNAA